MKRWLLAPLALSLFLASCTPGSLPVELPRLTPANPTVSSASEPTQMPTIALARTNIPTPAPTRTPKPSQTLWRGDLHVHTKCSDGWNTYEQMVQKALSLGFDFVAITDHNGFYNETRNSQCAETITKCRAETRLFCVAGEEEQGWGVHLLALGIPGDMDPLSTLAAQVAQIHQKGGLAIGAHPFSQVSLYTEDQLFRSGLDAMECAASPKEENQRQTEISKASGVPCVYDSDAHSVDEMGRRFTVCTVPVYSLADLKAAVAGGKCRLQ
jgi:PHP family Zn ribbon phosphoesterase